MSAPAYHHQAQPRFQPVVLQVAEIQSRSRAEVLRGTEQLGQLQREAEERLAAMRTQLEHQEIDKAALLDIVQVNPPDMTQTLWHHTICS